jgi:hypothetical protein
VRKTLAIQLLGDGSAAFKATERPQHSVERREGLNRRRVRRHPEFANVIAYRSFVSLAHADPAPQGQGMHGMRGMFTPEERMMLFADGAKATAAMTDDQRHAWRQQQREHFMSMSDADKAKMKSDLDTRWAALTADQQAAIKTKMDAFRAARMADHGGGHDQ